MIRSSRNGTRISHTPIFDAEQAEQRLSEHEGVQVVYVCTTDLVVDNAPYDIFYRDTPHPVFGNRYFGLRVAEDDRTYIADADSIEDAIISAMEDSNGVLHYSRFRHDAVMLDNGSMIDGGRAYLRAGGTGTIHSLKVINGELTLEDQA